MPFSRNTERIERLFPPTDLPDISEGDWIDINVGVFAARRQRLTERSLIRSGPESYVDGYSFNQALLEEVVRAWSDPSPVTPEALQTLHPHVQDWIVAEWQRLSAARSDEEKKDSNGSLPPMSGQAVAASPESSPTSLKSAGSRKTA